MLTVSDFLAFILVSPSLAPVREISGVYPAHVYICGNGPLDDTLVKDGSRHVFYGMMFMTYVFKLQMMVTSSQDQNTLNTFPGSE